MDHCTASATPSYLEALRTPYPAHPTQRHSHPPAAPSPCQPAPAAAVQSGPAPPHASRPRSAAQHSMSRHSAAQHTLQHLLQLACNNATAAETHGLQQVQRRCPATGWPPTAPISQTAGCRPGPCPTQPNFKAEHPSQIKQRIQQRAAVAPTWASRVASSASCTSSEMAWSFSAIMPASLWFCPSIACTGGAGCAVGYLARACLAWEGCKG